MGLRKHALAAATLPFLLGVGVFYVSQAEAQLDVGNWRANWGLGFDDGMGNFQSLLDPSNNPSEVQFTFSLTTDNGIRFDADVLTGDFGSVVLPDTAEATLNDDPVPYVTPPVPSFTLFNGVTPSNTDFASIQFGDLSLIGGVIPSAQQEFLDNLAGKPNIRIGAGIFAAADSDGSTFDPGDTIGEALGKIPGLPDQLQGDIVLEFSDVPFNGNLGTQAALPGPANTTSLRYRLRLNSVEVNPVPLPAGVWLFLGALCSLAALRWSRSG